MGRLFWKVFFGFWLTMLIAAIVAALLVRVQQSQQADEQQPGPRSLQGELFQSPWVTDRLLRHAQILRHGGSGALRAYIMQSAQRRRNQGRPDLPVLVVDAADRDLLDRPIPARALEQARRVVVPLGQLAEHEHRREPGRHGDREDILRASAAALGVRAADGGEFLLFVPRPADGPLSRRQMPLWARLPAWSLVAAGVAFSLFFSGALAWYLARPIRALRAGLRRVAEGDLDTRVAPVIGARRDELADLGRDLDRTTERLQQLLNSQRRLLHDVSHELRSPLARLSAAVGIMRQTPARFPDMLQRLEQETSRLDHLVGEILTLARLDEDQGQGKPERVDLRELMADVAADASFEAQARGVRVETADGAPALYLGHPTLLLRAIENLVRNAVRFSPEQGRVDIALEIDRRTWRIHVLDRGPGISDDLIEKVQEPFVRGGAENGDGFGLGLAIARRAAQIHGGSLELRNRDGGGLVATIVLPAPSDTR
ncbi:MAG: ATP-binding protein [Burkholderiaceae bacterium]